MLTVLISLSSSIIQLNFLIDSKVYFEQLLFAHLVGDCNGHGAHQKRREIIQIRQHNQDGERITKTG